jgi:hypothetical protein
MMMITMLMNMIYKIMTMTTIMMMMTMTDDDDDDTKDANNS